VIPTSNAVISDYFPAERRSGPLAIFTAGATVGITVGMAMGGWVGDHFGWRWAFIIAGAPGLLLAVLVRLILREPPRGHSDGVIHEPDQRSLFEVLSSLARNRAYVLVVSGACFANFLLFGVTNWMPPYLVRRFGMSLTEVGAYFGTALGLGGAAGAVLGGFLANRLAERDLNWMVWIPAGTMVLTFPLYELAVFAPGPATAIWLVFVVNVIGGSAFGPVVAAILSVVRAENRATGASVYGFAASIIGIGAAPFIVGVFSDALSPRLGGAVALQYALALTIPLSLVGAVCYWLAAKTFKETVAANR
jgi:predicted MFS family arabinose efflux permease